MIPSMYALKERVTSVLAEEGLDGSVSVQGDRVVVYLHGRLHDVLEEGGNLTFRPQWKQRKTARKKAK